MDEKRFLPVFETLQGFAEEPLSGFGVACLGQIEINRMTLFVHCPVEVDPSAAYFNVGLVDMPASSPSEAAPGPAQTIFDFWSLALHPAVDRCVVERNSTFLHHFFQFAIADTVFAIPAHCPEDDFSPQMPPFELMPHHTSPYKVKLYPSLP